MSVYADILKACGFTSNELKGGSLVVRTPIDGSEIAALQEQSPQDVDAIVGKSVETFYLWRQMPPPIRGELVRLLGEELRINKENIGRLVSLEAGKILSEGQGEVQEMIDICDFALGQSRQLYGNTIASERPGHHMREMWHPLGPVGVITAFNFPVAVWSWNTCLALICGDPVIWKPSDKTPLTALACAKIFDRAVQKFKAAGHECPPDLLRVVLGGQEVGKALVDHPLVPLISATGSTNMGQEVAGRIASRLGRSLLELGGNNGMILSPSADLEMAVRAIVFGAVGTAGQRCTSLRRLIVHESIKEQILSRLQKIYESLKIGNPLEPDTLVGPLIDQTSFEAMEQALEIARKQGGRLITGGGRVKSIAGGFYPVPAIVEMPEQTEIVQHETFAPILYVLSYQDFESALATHNAVPQGLSSCIFTNDVRESEAFLSALGSDCGIANVNIGPSGAEIGGAFGGEKATGGGRESGSDAWKAYMRRQTQTINYSRNMPLAQGVKFNVE